jgi:hypothetical protein
MEPFPPSSQQVKQVLVPQSGDIHALLYCHFPIISNTKSHNTDQVILHIYPKQQSKGIKEVGLPLKLTICLVT